MIDVDTRTGSHDRPGRSSHLAGIARGGLASLAGAGFAGVAGLAVAWLVARSLGPATAGVFFAATAAFALAAGVAKLGTPTGLVYWFARLRAQGRPDLLAACLRTGTVPVLAAGVALAVALWLAAPWLGERIGGTAGATAALRVLAPFLPLAALADALLAATRGHQLMRPTVALDKLLRPTLQLLALASLAAATAWVTVPLPAWPLAWALPYVPVLVLAGYACLGLSGTPQLRRCPDRTASPEHRPRPPGNGVSAAFWRFTGPRAVASVLQLALQRLDILLVAVLAGAGPAAIYAVAGRFVVLGQLASQAIGYPVQPRLAERLSVGDRAGAGALYQTTTGWLVLATWPLYLLVIGYAPAYLGLFGEPYRAGGPIVVVLAAAMLLATACGTVDMLLAMAGRTSWNLLNVGLALAAMVAVDAALIPRLGGLGAAIGLAVAVATNNLLPLAQVWYALRLHPFGPGTLVAAGLSAGCFGVLPLLVGAVTTGPVAHALTLAAAVAGYLVLAYRLRRPLALTGALTGVRAPRSRSSQDSPLPGGDTISPGQEVANAK